MQLKPEQKSYFINRATKKIFNMIHSGQIWVDFNEDYNILSTPDGIETIEMYSTITSMVDEFAKRMFRNNYSDKNRATWLWYN